MNKAEYLVDVLTPVALEKLVENHSVEEIEVSNLPYFTNPDASRQKMVQAYKEANTEIIDELKAQLAITHYELSTIGSLKRMLDNTGRATPEEMQYANDEYDLVEKELNDLMDQLNHALKSKLDIEAWFQES